MLDHPLFDVFLRVKWFMSKPLYAWFLMVYMSHYLILIGYSLTRFNKDPIIVDFSCYFYYGLFVTTILFSIIEMTVVSYLVFSVYCDFKCKSGKRNWQGYKAKRAYEFMNATFATLR